MKKLEETSSSQTAIETSDFPTCPLCGYKEEEYYGFVTYHGEKPKPWTCDNCGAELVAHEHVSRSWEVTTTSGDGERSEA